MKGWPLVALGDIFGIARGGSPRPIDKYIIPTVTFRLPMLRVSDVVFSVMFLCSTLWTGCFACGTCFSPMFAGYLFSVA